MATFAADQKFWPPNNDLFDFTLTFEDVLMGVIPSCIAILVAPGFVRHNVRKPRRVHPSTLLSLKMGLAVAIFAMNIASLALRRTLAESRTDVSVAATVLDAAATLAISSVVWAAHLHSRQSSVLPGLYFALTMLLDATRSRSFFLRNGLHPLGAVAAVTGALKLVMLSAEEIPKTAHMIDTTIKLGSETTSGLWTRLSYIWLNKLLLRGYRNKITVDDIEELDPDFDTELLYNSFNKVWRENSSTSGLALANACFWVLPLSFLSIIVPQLCSTGFAYSQPFVLRRTIEHLENGSSHPETGNSLIGATALCFIGYAFAHSYGFHTSYRLLTQIRGALVAELFAKSGRLPMNKAQKISAVTLMTADIEGIAVGLATIYTIPLSFVQVAVGIYLLSLLVSYSCVLILIPLTVANFGGYFFGKGIASGFGLWNERMEVRIKETSIVLAQLPSIKMLGLGPTLFEHLEKQRASEIKASQKFRMWQSLSNVPLLLADIGTPAVVVAGALFWTGFDNGIMTAKQVFPTVAIVFLVQDPLIDLLKAYTSIMTMLRAVKRIQDYFRSEENVDSRIVGDQLAITAGEAEQPAPEKDEKHAAQGSTQSTDTAVVKFDSASICPSGNEKVLLRDLDFTAAQGSLTGVVGTVGSGKSTFLHSLIGEADIKKGTVHVKETGAIGYCDQDVWLRNGSIRDNVVGPAEFNLARYNKVMRICRMNEDLEDFEEGDAFIVGSNGSNLSGGQRQRLALARALFLDASLMVLDDIFSALDNETAVGIFNDLFGETGMLRNSRCTVILSTHLPECLDVADQLLVLDGKGNATLEQGFKEGPKRDRILKLLKESATEPPEQDNTDITALSPMAAKPPRADEDPNSKDISRWSLYSMFIRSMGLWMFGVYILFQIPFSALEVVPEIFLRIWVEVAPKNKTYYAGYATLAGSCCLVGCATSIVYFVIIVARSAIYMHRMFSDAVMRATLSFLSKTDTGSILNKYSQDLNLICRQLPSALYFFLYVLFGLCVQLGSLLSITKWIGIAIVPMLVVAFWLQSFYLRTSRQMRHLELETQSPLYTQILETSSGLRHIRAFKWQDQMLKDSWKLMNASQKPFYTMYSLQRWLTFIMEVMFGSISIVFVAIAVHLPKSITEAGLGLGFLQVMMFGRSINRLIDGWTRMEISLGSVLRLYLFQKHTPVEPRESFQQLPKNWPARGNIRFEGVTAWYKSGDEAKIALRNVSFTVAPGQKVGLKGRTGSGKSSILLTLLGFLEYSGKIFIDDIDISTIAPDELRAHMVTISQHSVKFGGTVRDNLLPFQMNETNKAKIEERDDEVQEELKRLGLWDIIQEKGGLDVKLEEAGLSGGQLQMFCIARAILRNREMGGKIVLVDEGTSKIDYKTDSAIQKALKEAFVDCTVMTIAHRTNTIDDCDVQIELSKGEIVKSK